MATTDERDADSARDATDVVVLEGDDIVVQPDGPDAGSGRRGRPVLVGAITLVAAAIAVVVALALRSDGTTRVSVATPSTVATAATVTPPANRAPHEQTATRTTLPRVAATTTPTSVAVVHSPPPTPAPVHVTPTVVVTAPPPTAPPVTAAPKEFPASALTWTAPSALYIPAGTTKAVSVTAHNGTDGTVNLPHPLSCTPRLDHSEICPQTVQTIAPGGSASATYTIDAHGTKANDYFVLNVEGVLSIAVYIT